MNEFILILVWFTSWIIPLLIGFYIGASGMKIDKEIKDKVEKMYRKEKPKPGVVKKLTEEQLEEKRNPAKRGNLESFNRFFREHPIVKK